MNLEINCKVCTFLNQITRLDEINYCSMCCTEIYKPDNEMLTQIKEANNRKKLIEENFRKAYESIPSSFIPSNMIYLNANIRNGNQSYNIKFLIDTGAQVSVLPLDVAKALMVDNIIDESYNGSLKGVGNDMIMGKIHYLEVELPFGVIPCSFVICKNPDMVPILGIDMMQQLGLKLDFEKRKITFSTYHNTDFSIDM